MCSSGLSHSVMQNKALHTTAGTGNLIMHMHLCYTLDADRLSVWMIIGAIFSVLQIIDICVFGVQLRIKDIHLEMHYLGSKRRYKVAENQDISIGLVQRLSKL